jgi:hypothetical protein
MGRPDQRQRYVGSPCVCWAMREQPQTGRSSFRNGRSLLSSAAVGQSHDVPSPNLKSAYLLNLGLQGTCDLHALFKSHALKSRTAAGLTLIFPFAYCAFIFAVCFCLLRLHSTLLILFVHILLSISSPCMRSLYLSLSRPQLARTLQNSR